MATFSFLLPTRGRPERVRAFLQSVLDTASRPEDIEVVLAVDEDDAASQAITCDRLHGSATAPLSLRKVTMKPGATMGSLNRACFDASSGRCVMLMNDDVIARTRGWDQAVRDVFEGFGDDIALVHVNDLISREKLCSFPILSRRACREIGLCPAEYRRYYIDNHIYDTYALLAQLGHRRVVYLEEVVFEHENYVPRESLANAEAFAHRFESEDGKVYLPQQEIILEDVRLFEKTLPNRKADARTLAGLIDLEQCRRKQERYEHALAPINDLHYRRPRHFVRETFEGSRRALKTAVVTVAVVTADASRLHARRCLTLVKKRTPACELIVLDNNGSADFCRAREMNKVLQAVNSDFVAFLDDDVFVSPGWLEGLVAAVDTRTGVVAPMHRDPLGAISHSGICLDPEAPMGYRPTVDMPPGRRRAQCVSGAALLVDLRKCGQLFFSEAYQEHMSDLDYCLRIAEAGYDIATTPDSVVTRLGGGRLPAGNAAARAIQESDYALFEKEWLASGRVARLRETRWAEDEYLRSLSAAASARAPRGPRLRFFRDIIAHPIDRLFWIPCATVCRRHGQAATGHVKGTLRALLGARACDRLKRFRRRLP